MLTNQIIKLNLARNCLRYLIKIYGIKEIFVPYYSCNSIWQAIKKENCRIKFYHINERFLPSVQFNKKDFILYINYFGLCSLRKFFNVQNGAYLYTTEVLDEKFEKDKFLFSPVTMQKNYEKFVQNELILDNENIKYIYPEIEEEMLKIDFEKDKQNRIKKYKEYQQKYNEYNLIRLNLNNQITYCYPLSTNNDKIKQKISEWNIPLLSLWGNISTKFSEYQFLNNTVALPLI